MRLLAAGDAAFIYGNTRLRARKADLLRPSDYDALVGLDLDALLGALAATAYRPDLEAALPRFHGVRRLHEAVRTNLARSLRELRGFYDDAARALVDLMLSAWDLRNLLTLLRGHAARADPDNVVALIVPVGGIDEAAAREVARQAEFAAAVELLLAWRLPTPDDAAALRDAWPAYERSGDLAALEHALVGAHAARRATALARAGEEAEPLRAAAHAEVDDQNLLTCLRLGESAVNRELAVRTAASALLAGGSLPAERLAQAVAAPSRTAIADELRTLPGAGRWRAALERWAKSGDLAGLDEDLAAARARARIARFAGGDPLGLDIPLAFAAAKEVEARNLRVLAASAADGTDPRVVRARLLLA